MVGEAEVAPPADDRGVVGGRPAHLGGGSGVDVGPVEDGQHRGRLGQQRTVPLADRPAHPDQRLPPGRTGRKGQRLGDEAGLIRPRVEDRPADLGQPRVEDLGEVVASRFGEAERAGDVHGGHAPHSATSAQVGSGWQRGQPHQRRRSSQEKMPV